MCCIDSGWLLGTRSSLHGCSSATPASAPQPAPICPAHHTQHCLTQPASRVVQVIEVHLPQSSRSHARASFDGRHTMRMLVGAGGAGRALCFGQARMRCCLNAPGFDCSMVPPPNGAVQLPCKLAPPTSLAPPSQRDSSIVCRTSRYALPMINMHPLDEDWWVIDSLRAGETVFGGRCK